MVPGWLYGNDSHFDLDVAGPLELLPWDRGSVSARLSSCAADGFFVDVHSLQGFLIVCR